MSLKVYTIALMAIFFNGCQNGNLLVVKEQIENKKKISNELPNWILNPQKNNRICSVGSSKITNIDETKKIALITAKSNISKDINIHIQTQLTKQLNCNSKECKKSFKSFSEQQASNMINNISISDEHIDKSKNRYYIRACSQKSDEQFKYTKSIPIKNKYKASKISCIQQSNYPSKTLDQQKDILIQKAKFEALGELYGHLLYSKTNINNGKIVDDSIKQRAIGNIRIEGNPSFYNGKNLGEICSNITAYVTKKDLEKFKPKKVKLNNFCYNNPNTPTNKIKEKAKFNAYKTSIEKFKPSLKNISDDRASELIHGFVKSNEKFDFNTGVYCFDSVTTILPYELELITKKSIKTKQKEVIKLNSIKKGLIATFYNEIDYNYENPIFKTTVGSLNLANKSFLNSKLKRDTVYLIKLDGFIKSDDKINQTLKLYSDVYSAKVYINDKKMMDNIYTKKQVLLKKGLNKLKIIIKSSNAYDIKLIAYINNAEYSIDDIYTKNQ